MNMYVLCFVIAITSCVTMHVHGAGLFSSEKLSDVQSFEVSDFSDEMMDEESLGHSPDVVMELLGRIEEKLEQLDDDVQGLKTDCNKNGGTNIGAALKRRQCSPTMESEIGEKFCVILEPIQQNQAKEYNCTLASIDSKEKLQLAKEFMNDLHSFHEFWVAGTTDVLKSHSMTYQKVVADGELSGENGVILSNWAQKPWSLYSKPLYQRRKMICQI